MKQFLQRKLSGVLVIGETRSLFPEQGCSHLSNDQDHLQTLIKQRARSYPQSFWFSRWGCVQTLHFFPFLKKTYFIYSFLFVLGLHCCTWAFSSCGKRGYSSLQSAGFSLWKLLLLWSMGSKAPVSSACGTWLSSCVSRALDQGLRYLQHVDSVAVSHRLWIRGFGTYSMWTQ